MRHELRRHPVAAAGALEEALVLAESVGNRLIIGVAMTALVALRGRSTPVEPATFELFGRVVLHWSTAGNPTLMVTALRNLVILLGRVGRDEEAVELWAAVSDMDALHPSYGAEVLSLAHVDHLLTETAIRSSDVLIEVNGMRHPLNPPGVVIGRGSEARA